MPPFFSVIVPVYNKEKYIKKTLESILNQNFQDFEIIIVDDGSTDASIDIIKQFKDDRIFLHQQKNSGVAIARNVGGKLAKGKVLSFLDADDLWLPEHLSEIKSLFDKFNNAHFFATGYIIQYNDLLSKKFVYPFEKKQLIIQRFYQYNIKFPLFFTSNFSIKKDTFLQTKGFKPSIHGEDTEYFLRLGISYFLAYSQKITMIHLDKTDNSLFSHYNTNKKTAILESFKIVEQKDKHLKKYLDINRYVWAIEYKISGQNLKAQSLIDEINPKHLNYKQKILLQLPGSWLKFLTKIKDFLLKKGIRISVQS